MPPEFTDAVERPEKRPTPFGGRRDRETGKVKWYDANLGYGFIIPDSGEPEVFVHGKQLMGPKTLLKEQSVSYTRVHNNKGFRALSVSLVQ